MPRVTDGAVLIAAFEGWNDAANAASDAVRYLIRTLDATEVHALDSEAYFDFQAARPQVEIVEGVVRHLRWPTTRIHRAEPNGRTVILALGIEPNLHWPAYCAEILRTARDHGVHRAVTLGALLGDVPHTRPVVVTGTASDPRTAARLGLQRSRYEGPTGIVGVLADQARMAGFTSLSLWAPVPHYVASAPNPKATLALLERLGELLELELDTGGLAVAARAWEQQVDSVAEDDEDLVHYVHSLEARYDSGTSDDLELLDDEPDDDVIAFDDDWDDDPSWDNEDDWDDDDEEDDEELPGRRRAPLDDKSGDRPAAPVDDTPPASDAPPIDESDLPSAETLAADIEEFLRRQGEGPDA